MYTQITSILLCDHNNATDNVTKARENIKYNFTREN